MNKREFLKSLGVGGLALATQGFPSVTKIFAEPSPRKLKNWAWVPTDRNCSEDDWKKRLALWRSSGLNAVLPLVYDSRHAFYRSAHLPVENDWLEKFLPLAKAEGLEVHAWIESMPCNIDEVAKEHPEWFCVDRDGDSVLDKTPYVPSYRFMCPTHPGVQEFVKATVEELCKYPDLDGVHFDYIRYPDVILPVGLQPRYGLKQDHEFPEYDFCYCDLCRSVFKKQTGIDIRKVEDPPSNVPWRQFRYDRVTELVNGVLIPAVHAHKKIASAAVFPDWEYVRQEWPVWNLDAVLPMLYHGYYDGGVDWIGAQTKKGVASLKGRAPLYSGLMVRQMGPGDLAKAIDVSLANGAEGVVFFTGQSMTDDDWKTFKSVLEKQ
jgi:uncharacterized lipoprotein YddW (UPF0748 family)